MDAYKHRTFEIFGQRDGGSIKRGRALHRCRAVILHDRDHIRFFSRAKPADDNFGEREYTRLINARAGRHIPIYLCGARSARHKRRGGGGRDCEESGGGE